jgi:hypothetical protein
MTGRNDPCTCGSGKKYKKCCLPKLEAEATELLVWKEADTRLIERAAGFLDEMNPAMDELIDQYWDGDVPPGWFRQISEIEMQQLIAWATLDWRPEAGAPTVAERMAAEQPLDERQQQILASMMGSYTSVYEVVRIERGRGVQLENVLEGGSVFVSDRMFAETADKWLICFCRVYRAGPFHFILPPSGSCSPADKDEVIRRLEDSFKTYREEFPEAAFSDMLRAWPHIFPHLDRELRQRKLVLPQLQNFDGDAVVFCKATFEVQDPEAVAAAIRKAPEFEPGTPSGKEAAFVWIRRHGKDNRILGSVALEGTRMVLECNSRSRLERGIELLENMGQVEVVNRTEQEVAEAMQKHRAAPREDRAPADIPEDVARAIVQQHLEQHYERWPHMPLPALGGRTPAEAAATPEGRQQLEQLFRHMEFTIARSPQDVQYDFNKLRRRLGLI